MSHRYLQRQRERARPTITIEKVRHEDIPSLIEELAPSNCPVCSTTLEEDKDDLAIYAYCPICQRLVWAMGFVSEDEQRKKDWIDTAWSLR
jgi:rubrerythrin